MLGLGLDWDPIEGERDRIEREKKRREKKRGKEKKGEGRGGGRASGQSEATPTARGGPAAIGA